MSNIHNGGIPGYIPPAPPANFRRNSGETILKDTILAIAASCFALIAAINLEYSAPVLSAVLSFVPVIAVVCWIWRRFSDDINDHGNRPFVHVQRQRPAVVIESTPSPVYIPREPQPSISSWRRYRRVIPVTVPSPSERVIVHPLPSTRHDDVPPTYVPPQPTGWLNFLRPAARPPVTPIPSHPPQNRREVTHPPGTAHIPTPNVRRENSQPETSLPPPPTSRRPFIFGLG